MSDEERKQWEQIAQELREIIKYYEELNKKLDKGSE